ncbi:outer membrane lipoprotein-sorting protein [Horticoccus luteus]|uniref:Outer membrane lipoprotein-sorting protein n=1 Tax=Horticoccus luteus TaxID=2862869 RepID=A0A8F9XMY2_9BACT|nr:outer membrane lipoprotein-sorting protein [Horticoccus luteus]QYM80574.1 outer membrane lipoprotein-sorting protein [Horticoccus luteus]
MRSPRFTPAVFWRAFFVFLAVGAAGLHAQPASRGIPPPSGYGHFGQPDPAEGRKALEQFRAAGIQGSYYLEFTLRLMPRRGPEKRVAGRMWGTRNHAGPVSRVALQDDDETRLLVQNGADAAVWRSTRTAPDPAKVAVQALFEPIAGTTLAPFDLQMPFLYWNDFVYEGLGRVRGRPAYRFRMLPPKEFAQQFPALSAVRISLDSQFSALVEAELLDEKGRPMKSILVDELKKVGDQWMVKAVDVRNEGTRDKTRFEVTAVALGLDLSPRLFAVAALADEITPPEAARMVRFEP